MMVCDFFAIKNLFEIKLIRYLYGELVFNDFKDRTRCCLHIICEESAVSSWIGEQFFLIKALSIIKSLLSCEAISFISFSLQRSQVKKSRSVFQLFTYVCFCYYCLALDSTFLRKIISLSFIRDTFSCEDEIIPFQLYLIKVFRLECPDLCLTLYSESQCRGHNTAYI